MYEEFKKRDFFKKVICATVYEEEVMYVKKVRLDQQGKRDLRTSGIKQRGVCSNKLAA
jgi:hypothetical protein